MNDSKYKSDKYEKRITRLSLFSSQKLGPANTLHAVVRDVKKVKVPNTIVAMYYLNIATYNTSCYFDDSAGKPSPRLSDHFD